jgi:hypothetical protein
MSSVCDQADFSTEQDMWPLFGWTIYLVLVIPVV